MNRPLTKKAGPAAPPAGTGGHSDFDSNVSRAAGNADGRGRGRDKGPLGLSGEQKHGGGTGASRDTTGPRRKG